MHIPNIVAGITHTEPDCNILFCIFNMSYALILYIFQIITYDSTGDLLKQRKFYELLVNLRNRRYSKNPAIDVIISVTGNVSQKKFSPILENAYPSGTNKNTVLITVSILLVNAFPTA